MIERYTRKEIKSIWEDFNRYSIWLDIELAAAEAMEKLKIIPKGIVRKVKSKAKINPKRILQIENKVKHDIIAFLTSITEKAGKEARYLHKGMTSSDVLDTCFNLQLKQSGNILLKDIDELLKSIKKQALKHKFTLCIGRSHGIHAEPITFGLKILTFYQEFLRNKKRLETSIDEISTCAISGAVGTFANVDPRVEKYVAKKLKLKVEPISTQVIPRDRHAQFFSTLGIIASSVERFATEIRHLQRTEVLEVEEFFGKKQKGSSAMPHKKNPILSENLTGLARLIRSYVIPSLENVALWHERDISHSAVERNIGPDATIALDFALHRLSNVIKNLNIYPKKMKKNLDITNGIFFSQRVLLELTNVGFTREQSYKIVQRNAMQAWKENSSFYNKIVSDKKIINKISVNKLKKLMNKGKKLYEGKAKILYETKDKELIIQHFKDDATAFNNLKKASVEGKGVLNNRISEYILTNLSQCGIKTHFIKRLNMREQLIRKAEIFPIEFIVRNIATGSLTKRLGIPEGTILEKPLLEYCFKKDDLNDPLISKEHIFSFGWATENEIELIDKMTLRINDLLMGIFRGIGIKLVDFKIEYGKTWNKDKESKEIVLADEISPDTCRLWDSKTEKKLDKDRFRKNLGNIIQGYQEVARRLGIMPEETNISEVNFGKTIPIKFKKK